MARKKNTPTPKQQEILDFIEAYIRDNGYPPSIREICAAVNLKSSSTVYTHLEALKRKGYIERDDSKTRGIRLTGTKNVVNPFLNIDFDAPVVQVPVIGRLLLARQFLLSKILREHFLSPGFTSSKETFMLNVVGDSMVKQASLMETWFCSKTEHCK